MGNGGWAAKVICFFIKRMVKKAKSMGYDGKWGGVFQFM
jgi:hypothetical protein